MAWRESLAPEDSARRTLAEALAHWGKLRGGKTQNLDIVWIPKPRTSLKDLRDALKVAYELQLENEKEHKEAYYAENALAIELARRGAITRPGRGTEQLIEEYRGEATANQPHISSLRMANRFFRFLGWSTRRPGYENQYIVTRLGIQMSKFVGDFPATIGKLSERDLVLRSLLDLGVFSVNDGIDQWDTRFQQRLVVNILRCAAEYGYISNNELVVTAFALKDERDPIGVKEMMDRLRRLHSGDVSMAEAFREVGVDPMNASAVNNAYDSPKVLLSFCRQVGLFAEPSVETRATPYGDLRELYARMHSGPSTLKYPRRVNVITKLGRETLEKELRKRLVWFHQLTA